MRTAACARINIPPRRYIPPTDRFVFFDLYESSSSPLRASAALNHRIKCLANALIRHVSIARAGPVRRLFEWMFPRATATSSASSRGKPPGDCRLFCAARTDLSRPVVVKINALHIRRKSCASHLPVYDAQTPFRRDTEAQMQSALPCDVGLLSFE